MAQNWVIVAESEFLPALTGGQRENLGFIRQAVGANLAGVVVVPCSRGFDAELYRDVLGETPLLATRRRQSPLSFLHPRYPYVVASRPYRRGLADDVTVAARAPLTGVVTSSYKSHWIGEQLAKELGLPMIVRQHNREGAYHKALASGLSGIKGRVMKWEARRIAMDERRLDVSKCVLAFADISYADAEQRRQAGARAVLHVPPFAGPFARHDLSSQSTLQRRSPVDEAAGGTILFIGSLDVATNTVGLDWFIQRVWPTIRVHCPEWQLHVVGSNPSTKLVTRLQTVRGLTLHANVPSLEPYLAKASIAINPATTGSGVNIKALDYLFAGIPVVSTDSLERALPLRRGVDFESCFDAQEFSDALLRLIADPAGARRMGLEGRRRVIRLLDPASNLKLLEDAFAPNYLD